MVFTIIITVTIPDNILDNVNQCFDGVILLFLEDSLINALLDMILFYLHGFLDHSEIGIRATQISTEGGVERVINFTRNLVLSINLFRDEFNISNNLISHDDYEDDFENYISDEDFTYDRYEFINSDHIVDDSDWGYNSS